MKELLIKVQQSDGISRLVDVLWLDAEGTWQTWAVDCDPEGDLGDLLHDLVCAESF